MEQVKTLFVIHNKQLIMGLNRTQKRVFCLYGVDVLYCNTLFHLNNVFAYLF